MTHSTQDEIQLIQRAAKGDDQAFTDLFQRHFQAVYDFARWMSTDPSLAEDLTQEAFIRAHRNLPKFGPPWKLRAWLFHLTRNLLVDHTRRSRPSDSLDVQMPYPSDKPGPEGQMISAEQVARVRNAIRGLPDHHREALVLRELDGFSYADIAEIMEVSLDYVKVLLYRARAKFKENYGQRLLTEEPLPACSELGEMLDAYRDREVAEDQDRFVRAHLKECKKCQQRKRELTALAGLLAALPPFIPPPDLAPRILDRALKGPRAPGGMLRTLIRWSVAGAGTLLLAGLGWAVVTGLGSQPSLPTPSPATRMSQPSSDTPVLADPTSTLPGTIQAEFLSLTPSPTPSLTPTPAPEATPTFTPTATFSPAPSLSPTPSLTPTPTPEATLTFTPTATFTPAPDTQGPKVGGVDDSPDPIFTNGNPPDTATVSATVNDPSGVATVTLYYRSGSKGAFQVWGPLSGSDGSYGAGFGPFGSAGTYHYRIRAVDNLDNANCGMKNIDACPGGTLTVNIP